MNGGAYGRETKDALIEARGVDRQGRVHVFANADMHYTYRHCGAPDDVIFTQALFQGAPGDPAAIAAEMDKITESREATQPIKSRTGGSTFKNPPGHKAWQLIDAAGCRGLMVGDAQVSEMHCNFLINRGSATAADIETLGETVRRRVKETSGVELEWEIKRIGVASKLSPSGGRFRLDGRTSLVILMSQFHRMEPSARRLQPPRRRVQQASPTLDATADLHGGSGRREHPGSLSGSDDDQARRGSHGGLVGRARGSLRSGAACAAALDSPGYRVSRSTSAATSRRS